MTVKEDFSQIKLLSETEKPESDAFSSQKSDPNRSLLSEEVVRVVRSGDSVAAAAPTEQWKIESADESDQLFCRSDMRALTTRVIFPKSLIIFPPQHATLDRFTRSQMKQQWMTVFAAVETNSLCVSLTLESREPMWSMDLSQLRALHVGLSAATFLSNQACRVTARSWWYAATLMRSNACLTTPSTACSLTRLRVIY